MSKHVLATASQSSWRCCKRYVKNEKMLPVLYICRADSKFNTARRKKAALLEQAGKQLEAGSSRDAPGQSISVAAVCPCCLSMLPQFAGANRSAARLQWWIRPRHCPR